MGLQGPKMETVPMSPGKKAENSQGGCNGACPSALMKFLSQQGAVWSSTAAGYVPMSPTSVVLEECSRGITHPSSLQHPDGQDLSALLSLRGGFS